MSEAFSSKRKQGSMALLESHEVASFVVGFAVEPAPMKDADPLEGESTKCRLVGAGRRADESRGRDDAELVRLAAELGKKGVP